MALIKHEFPYWKEIRHRMPSLCQTGGQYSFPENASLHSLKMLSIVLLLIMVEEITFFESITKTIHL